MNIPKRMYCYEMDSWVNIVELHPETRMAVVQRINGLGIQRQQKERVPFRNLSETYSKEDHIKYYEGLAQSLIHHLDAINTMIEMIRSGKVGEN